MSQSIFIKKVCRPPEIYFKEAQGNKYKKATPQEKQLIFELRPELLTDEYLRMLIISKEDFLKTGIKL